MRDVAHAGGVANNDIFDLLFGNHGGVGAHQELLVLRAETADRYIEGRILQRLGDIRNRQAETGQPHGINYHAQHAPAFADQGYIGNALDRDQFWNDIFFNNQREFFVAQFIAQYRNVHNGVGVVIGFDHRQAFDFFR
jgi:hypothetical protein